MEATKPARSLLLLVMLSGCRAEVAEQPDGGAYYDLSTDDATLDDLSLGGDSALASDDLACPPGPVEICGNGCDDDRNGYSDDDDPACTPQALVTWTVSSPLDRLVLVPPFRSPTFDANLVPTAAHAVYSGAFAPGVAFVSVDGFTREILRVTLAGGGGKGTVQTLSTSYITHDLCVFNNELIVVERAGVLHRVQADGKTENGTVTLPSWMPANTMLLTSCSTDGKYLYVSEHAGINPSQFETLDKTFAPVVSPSPIPDQLLNQGLDRCLDFAWAHGRFYGLFGNSQGSANDDFPPAQLVPFALDGGIAPGIDAGTMHGLGDFNL